MSQPHRSGCRALRFDLRPIAIRFAPLALGVLALALGAPGCGESSAAKTSKYPPGTAASQLSAGPPLYQRVSLGRTLERFFGTPDQPTLWEMRADAERPPLIGGDPKTGHTEHLQLGRELFRKHCLHCHGVWGRGDGPTSTWLTPKPRNFWNGKFKFKSTVLASKPTRDDLIRTIRIGAHGTAMPSFQILEDPDLGAKAAAEVNGDERLERALRGTGVLQYLADYVIYLAMMGEVSKLSAGEIAAETADSFDAMATRVDAIVRDNYDLVRGRWLAAPGRVVEPSTPRPGMKPDGSVDWPVMYASVQRGRTLFLSTDWQCTQCHGKDATGAAPQQDLVDSWQKTFEAGDGWESLPRPANLTLGWYHRGGRPIDLFRQVTEGIDPMPGFKGDKFPESDRWDLVNYVRAVPYWGADLQRVPADVAAKAGGK